MKMIRLEVVLLILCWSWKSVSGGVSAPDVPCTSDNDCQSIANSACVSGICKCVFTYIRNIATGVCEQPSNTGYCSSNHDCGFGTCNRTNSPYICACEGTYLPESNCRLKACSGGLSTKPVVTSLVFQIVAVFLLNYCTW